MVVIDEHSEDWQPPPDDFMEHYGRPAADKLRRDLDADTMRAIDGQTGIAIRFIRQWKPPTRAEEVRTELAFALAMWRAQTQHRWVAGLTVKDRRYLRMLRISPE